MIDPPKNVTQDRSDKLFSAYPKTTPLFQPGAGLFSTQLQDSSILMKPEILKSIRVTETQTFLPKTTFQHQGPSAFQNRQEQLSQQEQLSSQEQLSQQIAGKPKPNNSEPSYPTSNLSIEWWPKRITKTQANGILRRLIGVSRVSRTFRCHCASKAAERY